MKKLVFLCFLGLAVLGAGTVHAQWTVGGSGDFAATSVSDTPVASTREQIALSYHRLAGVLPAWRDMAMKSDEYLNANDFDKNERLEAKISSLRNNFQLTSFDDKAVVKMPVTLSNYSIRNKGFIINELADNVSFKYNYAGRDYGLIPLGLADNQWIDATDEKIAATIEKARGKDSAYTLFVTISTNYADAPNRLTELDDGKQYNILTGPVDHISLYDASGKTFLWDNKRKEVVDPVSNELRQLKQ